jgi:hypothetical protein
MACSGLPLLANVAPRRFQSKKSCKRSEMRSASKHFVSATCLDTHIRPDPKRCNPAIPRFIKLSRLVEQDAQPDLRVGIDDAGSVLISSKVEERFCQFLVGRPGVWDESVLVRQIVGKDVLLFWYGTGIFRMKEREVAMER